jgi:hypothetical protein
MSKVAHTYQVANVHIIIYHTLTTDWLDSLKTFDIWKCINLSRIKYLITTEHVFSHRGLFSNVYPCHVILPVGIFKLFYTNGLL